MPNLARYKIWRNYPPFINTTTESGSLYNITESIRQAIEDAGIDAETGVNMMYLDTAEEEWLDLWGSYVGLTRSSGESDDDYRDRIYFYILRPLQTVTGIITLTSYYSGLGIEAIDVYEFFRDLAPVDFGAMSDRTRLQGIDHYTWGAIQITTPVELEDSVKAILEDCVASGIFIYYNPVTRGFWDLWSDSGLPWTTDSVFGHTLYRITDEVDFQVSEYSSRVLYISDIISATLQATTDFYGKTVAVLTSGYGLDPYGEEYYGSTLIIE